MIKLKLVPLALLTLVMSAPLGAVELLQNGNLELAGSGPPGWSLMEFPTTGTGTFDTAEQVAFADRSGDPDAYGLFLKPFAGGDAPPGRLVNAVLTQTREARPGVGYSFSGWSRWELNYAGGVSTLSPMSPFGAIASPTRTELEVAFLNGVNVIGTPYVLDLRTVQSNVDFWQQHDFDQLFGGGSPLVAPAGTTNVRVRASMLDGAYNADPMQAAFFDDFSLIASDTGSDVLINGNLNERPSEFPFFDVTESPMDVDTVNAQSASWAQNSNTSGTIGAFLHPWANGGLVGDPNDAILSQTVNGVAGGSYTFSVWSRFEGNYSGGVDTLLPTSPNGAVTSPTDTTMELAFLDMNQAVIGTPVTLDMRVDREMQSGGTANDGDWYQHSITATAPAGTTKVRVTASMLQGVFNDDPQQSAFFDDFSLMLNSPTIDGDFNNDGFYNCADINSLTNAVATNGSVALFDLNGDGVLSILDVDSWRSEAGGINIGPGRSYLPGDANLSGAVDGTDFNIWNAAKFTDNKNWCNGNFNASTATDGSDFNIWNANKFTSSDAAAVPEPGLVPAGLLFVALCLRRRRR